MSVGEWDVDRLAAVMPAGLFAEWMAFFAAEPWGADEDWLRAGQICATIVNANPFRGRGPGVTATDFVRKPPPPPELLVKLAAARTHADRVLRPARPGAIQLKGTPNVPVHRPRGRRQRPDGPPR